MKSDLCFKSVMSIGLAYVISSANGLTFKSLQVTGLQLNCKACPTTLPGALKNPHTVGKD